MICLLYTSIQSNQNDQHGGQSVPNFDYGMAPGVKKTYKKLYYTNLGKDVYKRQAVSVPFCDKILLLNRMELKTKI